jgi:hypothetical protein
MEETDYFEKHIQEYKHNADYYKFKITDVNNYSFLIIIHKKKSLIDLYEEVDLRLFELNSTSIFFLYYNKIDDCNKINLNELTIEEYFTDLLENNEIKFKYRLPRPGIFELFLSILNT